MEETSYQQFSLCTLLDLEAFKSEKPLREAQLYTFKTIVRLCSIICNKIRIQV